MVTEYVSLQLCLSGNKLTGIYVCRIPLPPPPRLASRLRGTIMGAPLPPPPPPCYRHRKWGREAATHSSALLSIPYQPTTLHHSCVKRRRKGKALWVLPPSSSSSSSSSSSVFFLLLGVAVRALKCDGCLLRGGLPKWTPSWDRALQQEILLTGLLKKQAYLMHCDKVFLKVDQTSQNMSPAEHGKIHCQCEKGTLAHGRMGKGETKGYHPSFFGTANSDFQLANWKPSW